MKKFTIAAIVLAFAWSGYAQSTANGSGRQLEEGFRTVPDSVRIAAYWYWISDHISREGVVKDLHAMKEAGITRAFIGNIGLEDGESGVGPVKFGSDEWWAITHTALKTATALGIEIGIFNSPGWSQSGGPWVKPEESMRYLASTTTRVTGGGTVSVELPRPVKPLAEHFQDVKVIAFPDPQSPGSTIDLSNARVTGSGIEAPENILDGSLDTESKFSGPYDRGSRSEIDFTIDRPFTLRGLKLYAGMQAVDCPAEIQVREGDGYRTLARFSITRYNPQLNVGFDPYAPVVISVPPTTATEFRLVVTDYQPGTGIRELVLSETPFVERYPEKTLAKMFQSPLPYWHEYMWPDQPLADKGAAVVDPAAVIDLTDRLSGDRLKWVAPAGNWIVMRTGMLPTGVTNAPARPEARGLEADKMSKPHIESHFEAFLGEIYRRIPAEDRACWKVVVEDSYETGGQNFTDGFLDDFRDRYGYDPVPYLPVYEGIVVGSQDISDRFLWDMRRLVADKIAYDYVAGLREVSHRYGLTTWLENYGHWGFPGEFLQYGGQSDEIGGEYWSEGALGDIENRAASSCGHIYGKQKIWAESFTAGGGGYHRYPAMMKQRGDRFFAEGINATLLHLVISQPYEDREPGVNATFSNEFNRKNTWYPHMGLFTDYLKRVNYMLQQGLNVADIAYFIGEDAPKMTGVTDPEVPDGYQFDYINAEVLFRDARVSSGKLTLPHGTQYSILVLPKQATMRPELLAKLERLIEEGLTVLGPAPVRSPSLEGYPEADDLVAATARRLWGRIDPSTRYARIGKGMLIDGVDMTDALALVDCVADCASTEPVYFGHRTLPGIEIYFIANPGPEPMTTELKMRTAGMQPELWDAVSGTIRPLPSFLCEGDVTTLPAKLDGYGSMFIVFRTPSAGATGPLDAAINFPAGETILQVDTPWTVSFDESRRGPGQPVVMDRLYDITQSEDFDIAHYSGMLRYDNTFTMPSTGTGQRIVLDLNDLTAMATVTVNGRYAGGVWTPPYSLDITDLIREGENTITVEVSTTWKNRLVGDLKLPESERRTWVAYQPWTAAETLQPSGLFGPVTVKRIIYNK